MVWFSDRKKLDDRYKAWIITNNIADTSFNVIGFLADLLDEEKVKEFLEKERNNK